MTAAVSSFSSSATATLSSAPAPALCLTCASSIPPKSLAVGDVFLTRCCERPICSRCLSRNPRLRAYDPCLACLGGVSAAGSSGSGLKVRGGTRDGATSKTGLEVHDVLEGDMFTIGDDDDDGEEGVELDDMAPEADEKATTGIRGVELLPPYSSAPTSDSRGRGDSSSSHPSTPPTPPPPSDNPTPTSTSSSDPNKYYIQSGDTLSAIALRISVDGRRLAKLNNLPPSTLSTTPHLLHTRRFLILPANARIQPTPSPLSNAEQPEADEAIKAERERARRRERAEKRFAFVTKEVDYRVAKAYVAIADEFSDSDTVDEGEGKLDAEKKKSVRLGQSQSTESRAVDRYLDDEEWETNELRAGRMPRLPSFPLVRR